MRSYLKIKVIAFLCLYCCTIGVGYGQQYQNEVSALADNDVYISYVKDRYYTNGLSLYFRHALQESGSKANQSSINPSIEKKIIELEVGQKIYNPYSSNAPDLSRHDRPFTAHLYGGASLNVFYQNEGVFRFRIQAGVMGASALGRQTQSAFHKLFRMHPVQGWEHQLNEEWNLNTHVAYDRLLYRGLKGRFDISGQSAVLLGNTYSGAQAGTLLRVGVFNLLHQSSSYSSRIRNKKDNFKAGQHDANSPEKPEIFVFARPQLNYVVYNATIEGPLFRSQKGPVTFETEKIVYSQQIGLDIAKNHWSARYMVTLLSKEAVGEAKPSYYASINLGYSF